MALLSGLPTDISISNLTSGISALSNLIAVTPYSYGINGTQQTTYNENSGKFETDIISPPTFLFDYEGEQTLTLESDITDHFIENNSVINDQIALRAEIITTHGFIGELNDIPPNKILNIAQTVAQKLYVVSAYTPELSATGLLAYNEAMFAYQTIANAISAVGSIGSLFGKENQTKQAIAFQQFYQYWNNRTLFTVITPWGSFENMAIKTLRTSQDADTRVITNFEITFKKMRFADSTITDTYAVGVDYDGRGDAQFNSNTAIDNGTNQAPLSPVSQQELLSTIA